LRETLFSLGQSVNEHAAIKQKINMKKLTTFTASILLGLGLVSCKGDQAAAADDKAAPEKEAAATPAADAPEVAETVSLTVSGMT
jgi:hypothetical protein